jgi:hypothetical protein
MDLTPSLQDVTIGAGAIEQIVNVTGSLQDVHNLHNWLLT